MSRKYNVSKRKNKGIVGGTIAVLATILVVGGLGAVSKGFTNCNVKEWFKTSEKVEEDTRLNVVKVNLETDVSGATLNNATLISFLNEGQETPIFSEVPYIEKDVVNAETNETTKVKVYLVEYVFKDNGGMKFGSSKNVGSFTANLVEDYKFNCVKIVGRNYSALNKQTNIYSCDESMISVNGAEAQAFKTNEEDNTKEAPLEEKIFKYDDMQTSLNIVVTGKRATLFSIELWTELADTTTNTEK